MGAGVLFFSVFNHQTYFLLGKENNCNKWSDFGGTNNPNETHFNCAVRECYEETHGIFGSLDDYKQKVKHKFITNIIKKNKNYNTFLVKIDYDYNLPVYYNNNYNFLSSLNSNLGNQEGLMEKKEIKWFTLEELAKSKNIIRPFYWEIIQKLIDNFHTYKH